MIHRFTGLDVSDSPIGPGPDLRDDVQLANPLYQVDDKTAADIKTAYKMVREMMNVNGAHVEVYLRTNNEDVDEVFNEDSDPTYGPATLFKAFFVPQPLEQQLTLWGLDADNHTEIVFIRDDVFDQFGARLFRPGDIIKVPFNSVSTNKPKYYQVTNAQESGNYRYQWFYVTCQATLLAGDLNLRPHTDMLEVRDEVR